MAEISSARVSRARSGLAIGTAVAAMAALTWSAPAAAQQASTVPAPEDAAQQPDIVVTAQKRAETLKNVPISIQAFGGEALRDAGIRDFSDIVTMVPGASEEQSWNVGQKAYQIRGVAQGPGDPTVGYYVDDTAFNIVGVRFAPIGRAFDMQRVEVLRGPQSTLYGAGSMGGTVRYITNQPNLRDFGGRAAAGYSDADGGKSGYFGDLALNVPLVKDVLAVRLTGEYERVGGYQDLPARGLKDVNPADIYNLRGTVLFKPSDRLHLKFTAIAAQANQKGGTFLATLEPTVGAFAPGDYNNVRYQIYSGMVEYDFGAFTASSTTSLIDFRNVNQWTVRFDVAGTPAPGGAFLFRDIDGTAINNETRLVSSGDGPFKWIVGSFYSKSKVTTAQDLRIAAFGISNQGTTRLRSESESVFGELSYDLLGGKLTPLVGLRYFTDTRSQEQLAPTTSRLSAKFESVNPRFNLTYKPDSHGTFYVNVAKGFRSGNFNDPQTVALHVSGGLPGQVAVGSDSIWSYEIGLKRDLFDRQLSLDAAVYYEDWQGIRVLVPYAGQFLDYKVGDARLYGVDLAVAVTPRALRGFSLSGSLNVNSSKFSRIPANITSTSGIAAGQRLPFVPDWTLAASATYKWDFGSSGLGGEALLGLSHIAAQLGQAGTPAVGDARDLLRARLALTRGVYSLALVGTNLLNERGAIYSQVQTVGFNTFTQDYPRTIGIEFGAKF